MPYKSGFSSFFDELLDQAGKVYLSMEEIKQRKAQLKQQQEQLNINAAQATNQINRTRLEKFRQNWDIATQMYQQKHPPAPEETKPKETTVRYIYEGLPSKGGGKEKQQPPEGIEKSPRVPRNTTQYRAERERAILLLKAKRYDDADDLMAKYDLTDAEKATLLKEAK